METAVMFPSPPIDFNFESPCTTPYMSAPSSPPKLSTPFFSAPTSPTRISSSATISSSISAVPFTWDDKPGLPNEHAKEFAFDFSGQLDKHYSPADELFDCGKIKPLKPPSSLNHENSPKSPRSPRKSFKRRDFDPFQEAFNNTTSMEIKESKMGIEFDSFTTPSSSRHNKTRSVLPLRVSDLLFDQETEHQQKSDKTSNSSSSSWYKKWKIKDLLLFRSASEGRATSKAQFKKYAVLKKNNTFNNINVNEEEDDLKNSSFRSIETNNSSVGSSSNSVMSSCRRRSGPISAHELHYTINRAVSEEMKKKTFLPYKQGLLGCLGFQQPNTDISRGVASMTRR